MIPKLFGLSLKILTKESFFKVFLPMALFAVYLILLVGNHAFENYRMTVFYSLGFFFHVGLGFFALFWSHRFFSAHLNGTGMSQLLLWGPMSRTKVLLSLYACFCLCFLLFLVLCFGATYLLLLAFKTPFSTLFYLQFVSLFTLNHLVTISLVLFFCSFLNHTLAFFTSMGLWILGFLSHATLDFIYTMQSEFAKSLVKFVARVWDFTLFNQVGQLQPVNRAVLEIAVIYGCLLLVILLSVTMVIYSNKDFAGSDS